MSDFIEQCRLEWKRLGVSNQLADEIPTSSCTSDSYFIRSASEMLASRSSTRC